MGVEFLEDEIAEFLIVLRLDFLPVQKESGSGVDAGLDSAQIVIFDLILDFPGVPIIFELSDVQTDRLSVSAEHFLGVAFVGPGVLIGKDLINHLPEFSLLAGRLGGAAGQFGVLVLGKGKVTVDEGDSIAEFFGDSVHNWGVGSASRALQIAVFNQNDTCLSVSFYPIGFGDRAGDKVGLTP